MPRIPNVVADCTFYLYESEHAARQGKNAGGSGFLVSVTAADPTYCYVYAVTNKHLVDDNFCALRLNRKSGDTDCIVTEKDNWVPHPDGDDVAIYPLSLQGDFKSHSVPMEWFADRECIETYNLGYGDDVFLVGRLIAQSGRQKNTPVVRFGNISLSADPTEPVKYNNREQEAFLVECRSISGFSGSPVFVQADRWYSGPEAQKIWEFRKRKQPLLNEDPPFDVGPKPKLGTEYCPWAVRVGPLLLGIDFGHLPIWNDVYCKTRKTEYRAQSNTGIAGVVPNWKIKDLLDTPSLVDGRAEEDEKLKKKTKETLDSFVLDAAQEIEEQVFTQQDFESALRKVSRRVEPSQSDAEKK
jgi:hypothetical protein